MRQLPLLPPVPVMSIKITVPGDPVPKGRHRARIVQPRGKKSFITFYQDSETEKYEAMVAQYARVIMRGRGALLGALDVHVIAWVPIPQSWSKKKHADALEGMIRPTSRPDGDNYLKAALDAMNEIVYHDDSQVVDMRASKRYSENPRLEIEIFAV